MKGAAFDQGAKVATNKLETRPKSKRFNWYVVTGWMIQGLWNLLDDASQKHYQHQSDISWSFQSLLFLFLTWTVRAMITQACVRDNIDNFQFQYFKGNHLKSLLPLSWNTVMRENLSVRRCKSVSWCCWAWDKQKKRTPHDCFLWGREDTK